MILAVAALAAAAFRPPLDRPLRQTVEQVRTLGNTSRRFVAERRIVFRRDPAGLVAEVTLVRLDAQAEPALVRNFRAAAGGLLGRAVRVRLTPAGEPAAIDGEAAAWAALLDGYRRLTPPRDRSIPLTADPAATLAALPPAERQAMLAEPLHHVLPGTDADAVPGERPVTIAGPSPLTGLRTVSPDGERLAVATSVRSADDGVTLDRRRLIDPATGLVVEDRETRTQRLDDLVQTTRTTATLAYR